MVKNESSTPSDTASVPGAGGTFSVRSRLRPHLRSTVGSLLVVGGIAVMAVPGGASSGDAPITGKVFRDVDANGKLGVAEPGQAGITVTATDSLGAVSSTASAADGSYTLATTSLGSGPFRLEFSGLPAYLQSGPHGTDNQTSVTRAAAGAVVDFGVQDPSSYCQANPQLAVTCFVTGQEGGQAANNLETVASFPYSAGAKEVSSHGTDGPPGASTPEETPLTNLGQTGSIYGEAWHANSRSLYLGAFAKRFVPFGTAGSGAIYVRHGGAPTLFYNRPGSADRTAPGGDWYQDPWDGAEITKHGWGDLDVLGNRLYAVNLEDRSLYVFDIDPSTGAMTSDGPQIIKIPVSSKAEGDSRPFALGVRDGQLYVGGVDSKESDPTGIPTAWIRHFDPTTSAFDAGLVANFDLGFARGCAYVTKTAVSGPCSLDDGSANWRSWGANPSTIDTPTLGPGLSVLNVTRFQVDPQPILSDIVFDDSGNMIIGFRDRYGDRLGRQIPLGTIVNPISPALPNVPLFLNGYSFGDTLRAARTGTSWTLENNGTSATAAGSVTGSAGIGVGPGGGEFYDGDNSLYKVSNFGIDTLEGHEEVTMGGLYHQPGSNGVATTSYDLFGIWDSLGVRHMTDTGTDADPGQRDATSLNTRGYVLYNGTLGANRPFGKTNGLGDLEALCDQAPVEIGDFTWFDADHDGVQDPGEPVLAGVTVSLVGPGDGESPGTVLATAVTDANGRYWFESPGSPNLPATPGPEYGVVPGGLTSGATYTLRFNALTADVSGLGTTAGSLQPTLPDVGSDTTDSDVKLIGGFVVNDVTVGAPGHNDHTHDAGFWTETRVLPTTIVQPTSTVEVAGITTIRTSTSTSTPIVVEGRTQTRNVSSLPVTGADSRGTLLMGAGMLSAGLGMLLIGRRSRRLG